MMSEPDILRYKLFQKVARVNAAETGKALAPNVVQLTEDHHLDLSKLRKNNESKLGSSVTATTQGVLNNGIMDN